MKKLILIVGVVGVLAVGGYIYMKKKKDAVVDAVAPIIDGAKEAISTGETTQLKSALDNATNQAVQTASALATATAQADAERATAAQKLAAEQAKAKANEALRVKLAAMEKAIVQLKAQYNNLLAQVKDLQGKLTRINKAKTEREQINPRLAQMAQIKTAIAAAEARKSEMQKQIQK